MVGDGSIRLAWRAYECAPRGWQVEASASPADRHGFGCALWNAGT